ncbi:MAG: hypothetical protein JSV24_10700 [Bacteroidales bacterium]|nr:MAG: hypothetical protein JSV24_10700 [Bacteroidales bacterium]
MDKLKLKRRLIELCIEEQDKIVHHAKARMDEAQQSANEYGQPQDRFDSYRTQMLGKRDMFAKQLCKAIDDRNVLDRIELIEESDKVAFGAVIVMEDQNLFVSISLGKINLENRDYFTISPLVPLYKAMEGLKKGDSFEFNGNKRIIIDLF